MKNSELEQRLKECNYRLSKMDERIKRLVMAETIRRSSLGSCKAGSCKTRS